MPKPKVLKGLLTLKALIQLVIFGPAVLQSIMADPLKEFKKYCLETEARERPSILRDSCEQGNFDEVKILLELNTPIENCLGPAAVGSDRSELILLLLQHDADPNQADENGDTPLLWSAYYGDSTSCKILLQKGAKPNHLNSDGTTALFMAVKGCQFKINEEAKHIATIKILLEAGADPALCEENGESAFSKAQQIKNPKVLELFKKQP